MTEHKWLNLHKCTFRAGEPLHCEEESQGDEKVPVSGGGEGEFHQNGDGGQEGEVKAEEEHNANGSADSPIQGQQ